MSYVSDHALYGLGAVDDTAQALLTRFGIGWNNSVRALYYVYMNVGTTDFQSDAVKILVQAAQAGLKNLGRYSGPIDGVMGPTTTAALDKAFPKRWRYMTWYDVLNQLANKSLGVGVKQKVASVLSGFGAFDDSSWAVAGSSVYGKTAAVTTTYKALQSQLGVTADGKLGPGTLTALQTILRKYPASLPFPTNVKDMGKYADDYLAFLKTLPASVKPATSKPSAPSAGISTTPAAPSPPTEAGFGFGGLLSNPLLIAGGVFAGLFLMFGRKKKAA